MMGIASKARTALALGLSNIARAASYRMGVKLGLNPVRRLNAAVPEGPFFFSPQASDTVQTPAAQAWQTKGELFSHLAIPVMGKRGYELAKQQFNREMLADQWVNWVTGVKA